MRVLLATVVVAAGLAAALAARADYRPATLSYRSLADPTSGDEFLFRQAIHRLAQRRSDAIFHALAPLLGGPAPTLDFVQSLPPAPGISTVHESADPPTDTIEVDPFVVEAITNDDSPIHDGGINQLPHEDAHLRQVTTTVPDREGGAQAFADLVAYAAARKAGIPYTEPYPKDAFDGAYADYVKQAQARGRDWILYGQFGHPPGRPFP